MTTPPALAPRPAPAPGGALACGLALCAGLGLLSAWRLEPPPVVSSAAPAQAFSGERAMGYLRGLIDTGAPRMVGTPANDRARAYLLETLRELGLAPEVQERYFVSPHTATMRRISTSAQIRNVLATLPGSQPELPGLLLVAHYDCVGAGQGAGDDGSGVASLLEIARALRSHPTGRRSVHFLFTDAEECGLLGAKAFCGVYSQSKDGQEVEVLPPHPLLAQVGAVINLEARGTRGPSLMFQTGPGSARLVEALAQGAPRPVLGSSFATVYEKLPNDTDLTVFNRRGLPGLNFAFIGGVEHYHTSHDDLAHLDPRSVQHHGDNALSAVLILRDAPEAELRAEAELVYFDLLALGVVRWPASASLPLLLGALAGLLICAGLLARGGQAGWVARSAAWGALATGSTLVLVVLLGQLAASWTWPATAFPADPSPWIVLSFALALACATLAAQLAHRAGFWGAWLAVWTSWTALGLAISGPLELVGFSYLFVVPALTAAAGGLLAALAGRERPALAALAALLPLGAAGLVLGPLFLLVYQALGLVAFPLSDLDGWPAFALYPAVTVLAVLPLLPLLCLRGAGRGALSFSALGFAVLAGLLAPNAARYARHPARAAHPEAAIPGQAGDVPYRGDLAFHQTFEVQEPGGPPQIDAAWHLFPGVCYEPYPSERSESYPRGRGLPAPAFLASAPNPFASEPAQAWPSSPPSYQAPALPLASAEAPRIEELESEPHGEGRLVRFRLRSPRSARMLGLEFADVGRVRLLRVAGQTAQPSRLHWSFSAPAEGLRFEVLIQGGEAPLGIRAIDADPGLPKSGAVLRALRDSVGSATSNSADLHLHSATYSL